jgi:hypothetical protein
MSNADFDARDEREQGDKAEQWVRSGYVFNRRSFALEMGLGVATATTVPLQTFWQTQSAICRKS